MLIAPFLFFTISLGSDLFPYPKAPGAVGAKVHENFVDQFKKEKSQKKDLLKENRRVLADLQKTPTDQVLTPEQASGLRNFLIQHPIAGDAGIKKYSGSNGTLGFCYGRATLAHVELLRRGVEAKNIRKLFILGEMRYQNQIWELHVATLAPKAGGGWWVMDGLFDQQYELKDWYQKILSIAVNEQKPIVRIYSSDPIKFLPISGAYSEKDMYRPEYNGFFQDLSSWLNTNPVKKEDRFF